MQVREDCIDCVAITPRRMHGDCAAISQRFHDDWIACGDCAAISNCFTIASLSIHLFLVALLCCRVATSTQSLFNIFANAFRHLIAARAVDSQLLHYRYRFAIPIASLSYHKHFSIDSLSLH
jgi:hypothetical protein